MRTPGQIERFRTMSDAHRPTSSTVQRRRISSINTSLYSTEILMSTSNSRLLCAYATAILILCSCSILHCIVHSPADDGIRILHSCSTNVSFIDKVGQSTKFEFSFSIFNMFYTTCHFRFSFLHTSRKSTYQ